MFPFSTQFRKKGRLRGRNWSILWRPESSACALGAKFISTNFRSLFARGHLFPFREWPNIRQEPHFRLAPPSSFARSRFYALAGSKNYCRDTYKMWADEQNVSGQNSKILKWGCRSCGRKKKEKLTLPWNSCLCKEGRERMNQTSQSYVKTKNSNCVVSSHEEKKQFEWIREITQAPFRIPNCVFGKS